MADMVMLNNKIKQSGLKKVYIAEKLGLSYMGYNKKVNGKSEFLASEIAVLKDLLNLSDKDVNAIFFRIK